MDSLLHPLLTFVLLYKYAAIFLILFFGALAAPIPSGAILLASFFFAAQGYMDSTFVALSGYAGYVAGDMAGYWFARAWGKELLTKIGLGRFLNSAGFTSLEAKIANHPVSTIFLSRFATTVSPIVNVMSGLSEMTFLTFILVDLFGEACEVGVNYAVGVLFGDNWASVSSALGKIGIIILAVTVLVVVILWKRWSRRNHERRTASLASTH